MPTSDDTPLRYAVDTSVAVAALDACHAAHVECRERVMATSPVLAGHAAFETYSVLTRMPGGLRLDAPVAAAVIRVAFPQRCWLSAAASEALLELCGPLGVTGGAVYDALVGEAARVNGRVLLTRDRRAQRTYDLLGVDYELLG